MTALSRWLAPAVMTAGFGVVAMAPAPAMAQSDDDLARVIVNVADVIMRGNTPYYRYGNYGYNDRLIVVRDRYGRPTYYRNVPRHVYSQPPYGNAYGYRNQYNRPGYANCNKHGKCKSQYYDPRYDRRYDARYDNRYDNRYYDGRYDRRYDRWRNDD
ncbi:hypothetical protein LVB77_19425 [Lysobacter sp. 5GHs7-4]|uniref:hypothetical protein n=1 Tax=Lysobacter sp. 5GHs7-4 TaxID=2904253 RepID=UPI001E4C1290|nr:hypothetical protein [Lysobacter sp. 5GHs7-4]UHQ22792.1 hypothetical protein LVB77_19425 [Lysobacter sp. 5GHs7-4]